MSKALDLRNAALRLAVRADAHLVLADRQELARDFSAFVRDSFRKAHSVVVMGLSTPTLLARCLRDFAGDQLTIAEPDSARIDLAQLSQIGSAIKDLRLAAEPFDLRLDPAVSNDIVAAARPATYQDYRTVSQRIVDQATRNPLLADESIDLVVIDCLANRLGAADTCRMRAEAFRVLRREGLAFELCLLADEPMPVGHRVEEGPWSGMRFPLEAEPTSGLEGAGFHGLTNAALIHRPVQVAKGVEIRAFVTAGYKGKQGVCRDQGHAVIYRGPWSAVHDDDGHRYARGARTAVCAKTYDLLMREPYRGQFIGLPPYAPVSLLDAPLFDCNTPALRTPAITKGLRSVLDEAKTAPTTSCCGPGEAGDGGTTGKSCC